MSKEKIYKLITRTFSILSSLRQTSRTPNNTSPIKKQYTFHSTFSNTTPLNKTVFHKKKKRNDNTITVIFQDPPLLTCVLTASPLGADHPRILIWISTILIPVKADGERNHPNTRGVGSSYK